MYVFISFSYCTEHLSHWVQSCINWYPYFVPDLMGKVFSLLSLPVIVACFFRCHYHIWNYLLFLICSEVFTKVDVGFHQIYFLCLYLHDHMVHMVSERVTLFARGHPIVFLTKEVICKFLMCVSNQGRYHILTI